MRSSNTPDLFEVVTEFDRIRYSHDEIDVAVRRVIRPQEVEDSYMVVAEAFSADNFELSDDVLSWTADRLHDLANRAIGGASALPGGQVGQRLSRLHNLLAGAAADLNVIRSIKGAAARRAFFYDNE